MESNGIKVKSPWMVDGRLKSSQEVNHFFLVRAYL